MSPQASPCPPPPLRLVPPWVQPHWAPSLSGQAEAVESLSILSCWAGTEGVEAGWMCVTAAVQL